MAAACLFAKLVRPFTIARSVTTGRALAAYWNKDWKPGPYPKTPEERAKAAKKYGLRPEDYEPYPDDGLGHGDYPKLPVVSNSNRDPYEDWDIPQYKRNYGEPMHVHADIYTDERLNPDVRLNYSYTVQFLMLFGVVGTILALYIITLPYPIFTSLMPKQYPYNELYLEHGGDPAKEKTVKHYTFELED